MLWEIQHIGRFLDTATSSFINHLKWLWMVYKDGWHARSQKEKPNHLYHPLVAGYSENMSHIWGSWQNGNTCIWNMYPSFSPGKNQFLFMSWIFPALKSLWHKSAHWEEWAVLPFLSCCPLTDVFIAVQFCFSVSEMDVKRGDGLHINLFSHPFHSSKRLRL